MLIGARSLPSKVLEVWDFMQEFLPFRALPVRFFPGRWKSEGNRLHTKDHMQQHRSWLSPLITEHPSLISVSCYISATRLSSKHHICHCSHLMRQSLCIGYRALIFLFLYPLLSFYFLFFSSCMRYRSQQ